MKKEKAVLVNWGLLLLLGLIWGSSFILIKRGLEGLTAMQVAAGRIAIAMLALLPLAIKHLPKVPRDKWWAILGVGLFGSGIPPFMFAIAQTHINSALTGIINATTPLFAFLLGLLFFGLSFHWLRLSGVLAGLAGSALLILLGTAAPGTATYGYGLLIVVATICYGTSVNLIGRYLKDVHPITISSVSFIMIGIPALLYLLSTDVLALLQHEAASRIALGYVAILAVVGTAYASIIFFLLTQRTSPLFASTVTYIIPMVALLWGIFDDEPITPYHLAGMALILAGVYLSSNRAMRWWQRQ